MLSVRSFVGGPVDPRIFYAVTAAAGAAGVAIATLSVTAKLLSRWLVVGCRGQKMDATNTWYGSRRWVMMQVTGNYVRTGSGLSLHP